MVVHLRADLEGSIDGFIEGTSELLGEVLGAEEDDATVELMSQEVIANVDALAMGTGRPFHESQVDLVDRLGSRWGFSGRPGCSRCLVASLMWGSLMSFRNLVLSWS